MNHLKTKWQKFYRTGEYRGFRKTREQIFKLAGTTRVTFTNGKKEIYAAGTFKEEALEKIFSQIDKHHAN